MTDPNMKLYAFIEKNNPSQNHRDLNIKINIFFKDIDKFKITDEIYVFQILDQSSFILPETKEIGIQNFSNYDKILEIPKLSKKKFILMNIL
jgi:hypothetical protein